ncbi:MAG: L,D-transpeptidase family protein [Planctomycetaceae bacterium]|nr:L,D-transpeptidase family protein [Planctomycetaceae bacterium]
MPRQVRDRQALTYGVWSVVFAVSLAGFAWKFGWLPVQAPPADSPEHVSVDGDSDHSSGHLSSPSFDSESEVAAAASQSEPPVQTEIESEPVQPLVATRTRRAQAPAEVSAPTDRRALPFPTSTFPPRQAAKSAEGIAPELGIPPGIGADRPRKRTNGIDDLARNAEAPSRGILFTPGNRPRPVEIDAGGVTEDDPVDRPLPRASGGRGNIVQVGGETPAEGESKFVERPLDIDDEELPPKPKKRATASNDPRIGEIDQLLVSDRLAAHKEMSKIYWKEPDLRAELQERIDANARVIYFSPQPHYMDPYVVNSGDQLQKIARQYQVPWEYLVRLNKIDPKRIRPNQRLKVIKGPFAALVDLSDFELIVHAHGYYVKRYQVGIGKDGSTPTGKFTVKTKLKNPTYYGPNGVVLDADDPSNPLGERWIDLGDSYGIHGTIEPNSIGKAASRGCIRLAAEDVEEVYDLLSEGSEVIIRN